MDHARLSISADDLLPLLGTHKLPRLIDVCLPEDIAANPHRLPTSQHVPHTEISERARAWNTDRPIVTICQKGLKLSHGAAAHLRAMGFDASALTGGNQAWRAADRPMLALDQAPPWGTVWVCPAPRDRRAALCAWVIRRWYDADARILWVPADHVYDVAERFGAHAVPDTAPLAELLSQRGLACSSLLTHVAALERATAQGGDWLDMLSNLHETGEGLADAALPVLDAAWAAHRHTQRQEAA
ncbi:rhodanese-like domain-containing protein [Tateyamaria sp. syn59]|uniref:rhodanese-like domain-containing protein n=1 Tax=Tateyamaria sp. syn59 TaxID=2576942 RepID=UPI0011BFC7B4|nr:rhodanese-like domain-containing protein [Tateyamaria sp. syn59]